MSELWFTHAILQLPSCNAAVKSRSCPDVMFQQSKTRSREIPEWQSLDAAGYMKLLSDFDGDGLLQ